MPQPDPTSATDLSEVMALVEALAVQPVADFGGYERSCMKTCMALGRALMKGAALRSRPKGAFEEGGVIWKPVVTTELKMMTLFGPIQIERSRFRAVRNGATRCVVEETAGLVAGFWTEPAAKVAAIALTEMPYERVESFFAEQGTMTVSRSSLLRLVTALSALWEPNRANLENAVRVATPIPENAGTVAVSLDGVMLNLVGANKAGIKEAARGRGVPDKGPAGFREASVGVISFYDSSGNRLETRRYARMPEENKATTKAWLAGELSHIKALRPDIATLAIADGAANNWSFLESLDADHELVDFFHTAGHLHRHISMANGAATIDTQAKLHEMRHALLTQPGAARAVFADMQRLREEAGTEAVSTTKTTGKKQPTFFDRHHQRMEYAKLRSQNLPIGTGVTESTCKLVVCDRLRRTGMTWSERGGQGIMTLRAHWVDQRFGLAWQQFMSENQKIAA